MMFQLDLAFAVELLALIASAALILASKKSESCSVFAKTIGILCLAASLSTMACTVYYGLKYKQEGYFEKPYIFIVKHEGTGGMMECPMMQKMMEKKMGGETEKSPEVPEGHEGHHPQ